MILYYTKNLQNRNNCHNAFTISNFSYLDIEYQQTAYDERRPKIEGQP